MAHQRSRCFFPLLLGLLLFPAPGLPQAHPNKLKNSPGLKIADPGSWRAIQTGVEFRKVTLERAEPHHLIDLKMVRFDSRSIVPGIVPSLQYNLKGADVKTLAEKSGAISTINANYFDEKGRPLGFLKTATGNVNPNVSKSSLFTGIFGIKNRVPFIIHRDDFSAERADEGVQVGPLLLSKGAPLQVTRGVGKQSRRSLIGLDKDQRMIIAVVDSLLGGLTWVEVQEFFGSAQWKVGVTDLLNLDGGGSAQLYFKGVHLTGHVPGTSDVPVAVGFFLKAN